MGDMMVSLPGGVDPQAAGEGEALFPEFLSEEQRLEIMNYLESEISYVLDNREDLETRWARWRRHRVARPETDVKNTPWEKSSNSMPPVSATNTNGIYAHVMQSMERQRPFFSAMTPVTALKKPAAAWQNLLEILQQSPTKANFKKARRRIAYETISLGTQVCEVYWEDRYSFSNGMQPGEEGKEMTLVYSGPRVKTHLIEDVIVRTHWEDVQEMPWIAFRYREVPIHSIRKDEALGIFQNVDDIVGSETTEIPDTVEQHRERHGLDTTVDEENPTYTLYKVYMKYDYDNDGIYEDLVFWIELESRTFLQQGFNVLGYRPITRAFYWEEPGSFYGIGVGHMAEYMQEEAKSMHDVRNNSLALSSLQILVTRRGSGIGDKEKFYPLKNLQVDDPKNDVQVFKFPDVSEATLVAESQAVRYVEQFTGASAAIMGQPDRTAKSGTSPSLQMFLAQQGNKIFNVVRDNLEDAFDEIGMFMTMLMISNREKTVAHLVPLLDAEEQEDVAPILDIDPEQIPGMLRFQVRTTDVDKTEEAKRQTLLAQSQLYSMYGQEMLQILPLVADQRVPPQMREFALKYFTGRTEMMEKAFALFGEEEPSNYVPFVEHQQMMLRMLELQRKEQAKLIEQEVDNATGSGAGPGSLAGAGGPLPPAGMGGTPASSAAEAPVEGETTANVRGSDANAESAGGGPGT